MYTCTSISCSMAHLSYATVYPITKFKNGTYNPKGEKTPMRLVSLMGYLVGALMGVKIPPDSHGIFF